MKRIIIVFVFSLILFSCESEKSYDKWLIESPADTNYLNIDFSGKSINPLGKIINPAGKTYRTAPHPYGLVLSKDGNIAVTANSGTGPFSVTVFKNILSDEPEIRQIPKGAKNDEDLLGAVFMGLAISPDNSKLYIAGGQENKIYVFNLDDYSKLYEIDCALIDGERDYTHGYIGDMELSEDGKTLYALDQIGFRMLIIDAETGKILNNIPTGRYTFGIALSPDEKYAYVANVGVFEYKPFSHLDSNDLRSKALDYPAFAYGSDEMKEGIKTDTSDIPGLGDPNVPESFSVWEISLEEEKVLSKVKTGFLVGQIMEGIPAVGGSSPNSVVSDGKYVYVSNGNNDLISVVDFEKDTVVAHIEIIPDERVKNYRGVIPFGLDLSPDNKTLYCACSGINAIASIDVESRKVNGFIPVGWFPSKVEVTPDNSHIIVSNAKGYGSGPNGGSTFEMGTEGSNIGKLMKGSVSIIKVPNELELKEYTEKVRDYNFKFSELTPKEFEERKGNPVPLFPRQKESPIKYIVFISKENRTYDEVYGQLPGGNGEAELARYGLQQTFSNKKGDSTVSNADVMINHWNIAKKYAISDNFYVASDHSADGHRWLVNTYPNQWVETSVSASYGGKRRMKIGSEAPGNYAFVGASGAMYPEDYNQHGSIWEHFERNNVDFFNFGFGMEMAGTIGDSIMKYAGVKYLVNFPVPGPLYEKSSQRYATYNMAIPDQFRADVFIEEFNEKWLGEGNEMPQVLTVMLPNDHGAGDRPWAGFPFRESYMADNDLALGRILEFLSNTPYWKNMAVIVTEDDSQDGVDHVDAHRSLLMVISPYAKKDYVSHVNTSFGSIFKTMFNILGIPYLNMYDATSTDLSDMFSENPDYSPYQALPVDKRVFDPIKALDPFDENFDWEAAANSPKLDYPPDLLKSAKERDKKEIEEREKLSNPRRNK
jgi:DNA-binding beta-propeller fold protein YncE